MLGAIIGDIVGSRWEFDPTNDYNFEWLSEENGFTDDTICTVAVADALLRGRDFGESIHDWCNRYPHPMGGYGGRFAQWVHSNNPQPYNSFGNGAAMRVSPVAHWYDTLDEVLDVAAATALPSHNHDEGIKGAQTVALAIFKALQFGQEAPKHIDEILADSVGFSGYDINILKEDVINRFDETCQGTVPVALWIIGESSSFEDSVRKAVSLGADADTLGAIVGSIAEAIWGIPMELCRKIEKYLPDDMNSVLRRFHLERPRPFQPRR
jgi:ADP-ribosylglycohydrolase